MARCNWQVLGFLPPRDRHVAITVLREALALGVNHIDTSDFYGPHVTNQIIREALYPYSDDLTIVTKIGARRGEDASFGCPHFLRQSCKKRCTIIYVISG